jgi:hypothetical protein
VESTTKARARYQPGLILVCPREGRVLPQISSELLRIPSENGSPINEYRISKGQIEFRSLDPNGKPFIAGNGNWRILDISELQLHFALDTLVAQWLMRRLHQA